MLSISAEMLLPLTGARNIAADRFIGYRDVFYNVTRVDMFEGYKEDLKVYAAKLLSQPKPGNVEASPS